MSPVDLLLILTTTATSAAYVCRIDALLLGTHRAVILAIHVGLAIITLLAVNEAFTGAQMSSLQDVAVWSGWALSVGWLAATFDEYRHAPPPSSRRPGEVPRTMLQKVSGARKPADHDGWQR